jgi:hypothetical protein
MLFEAVAAVTDLGLGEAARRWESAVLLVAVAVSLVASVVVGAKGWRREHDALALRAVLLSIWLLAVGTALVVLG